MAAEKVKRKLAAILSADVKGYSRLMGVDEVGTIRTLETYRGVISDLIQKKGGRVVDSPGDNVLAEFASVVDALESAVEIQRELKVRNADLSESRRMGFRMGINLGDVVKEGKRIYGDGVNIAARIEGLAEGGGICISGTAFDHIGKRLPLGYEYLGEKAVKNIEKPVRVYRVLMEPEAAGKVIGEAGPKRAARWYAAAVAAVGIVVIASALTFWYFHLRRPAIEPARVDKMAFPLPDKPSIAVLPFANMSGDPDQEYFSDGITEEIITALSKVPRLFVIARNSTFTYKGKSVKVKQVAEEMGVRYVLEGSVRKTEDKVRITTQLIDAHTGYHLWAEKYDRDLKDIFAMQDEISFKVVTALQVKLTDGEQALTYAGGTKNFEAYVRSLKGADYVKRINREGNLLARKMAEETIALDPNYPRGYTLLAMTHWLDVRLGLSKDPKQSLTESVRLYQKALAMNPSDGGSRVLLGYVFTIMRQYEKGMAEAEQGVAISPNASIAHIYHGYILIFNGMHKEAIEAIKKALRLDPLPPDFYWRCLGQAYCHVGMYEEAIAASQEALRRYPDAILTHILLAQIYALSGREKEARTEVEEILRINPRYSVEFFRSATPYKNPADMELMANALLKAGVPKTTPLPLPDKPSIAVLPFVNMSEDKGQEFFSDGLTEEIITALSKTPKLFVIARNSTFVYKGKPVNVQQVSRELGVKYVLEGSVRRSGDQLRITAQLIDATTGNHLWAERYDRGLEAIFAIQDEITMKILTSLRVSLTEGEMARTQAKGTTNLDAYLLFLQGQEEARRMNKDGNFRSRQIAQQAVALDPKYALAYSLLASSNVDEIVFGLSEDPRLSLKPMLSLLRLTLYMVEKKKLVWRLQKS